jgi:hypothetical protein
MGTSERVLRAAGELGDFTVKLLSETAGIGEGTVRTVLGRNRSLFQTRREGSGRRGGQPVIWKVRPDSRRQLQTAGDQTGTRLTAEQVEQRFDRIGRLSPHPDRSPELVTADELAAYAPRTDARALLHELLRGLLQDTVGLSALSIRTGEGVGLSGFDVRAAAELRSRFVPAGPSVWELGTGRNPRKKAQEDYHHRIGEPGDIRREATTYVAVSMVRFQDKDAWVSARKAEGVWFDVKALDADDLADWLLATPSVHVWFSERVGLNPREVATLAGWWASWSGQTVPPTPEALILGGRESEADALLDLTAKGPRVIGVFAGSREEARAFSVASMLFNDKVSPPAALITPGFVVSTAREWVRLSGTVSGSILIPDFDDPDVSAAIRNGNSAIVPMGPGDDRRRADVQIPRIGREAAREALLAAGCNLERAERGAIRAGRSLISFRRSISVNPATRMPRWVTSPGAVTLAPLVLVGSWSITGSADHDAVGRIAGRPYPLIDRELRALAATEDPPFVQAGDHWQLTAPEDAWSVFGPSLTTQDLDRWINVSLEVLSELDPILDVPPSDQLLAGAKGVGRRFSSSLRTGLGRQAALMGGDDGSGPDGRPWTEHSRRFVDALLASTVPELWKSLADVLPSLAEASPKTFLAAVLDAPVGNERFLRAMFTDSEGQGGWAASSPHTGLLWALELLCWSEKFAAEACGGLARLSEIDPGGRLANRPIASLRRALLPWHPQTSLSVASRLEIVSAILQRHPKVGWALLLALIPQYPDSTYSNARPLFRDWAADVSSATIGGALAATRGLVELALEELERCPASWVEFLDHLTGLPPTDLALVLETLQELDPNRWDDAVHVAVWRALDDLASVHRRSPTAQWALSKTDLHTLEALVAKYEPTDAPERHARLFDWSPDLPGVDIADPEAFDAALAKARREAVEVAVATSDDSRLTKLIAESPVPQFVGVAAAEALGDDIGQFMLSCLGVDSSAELAAKGWVARMADQYGPAWVQLQLDRAASLTEPARLALYLALPNVPDIWDRVEVDSKEVRDGYWKRVIAPPRAVEHISPFVERLLQHQRPWAAVDILVLKRSTEGSDITADVVENALRGALQSEAVDAPRAGMAPYSIGTLLDQIQSMGASDQTMAELEWAYFGLLHHTREPAKLYSALANDPTIFVDLVCSIVKPDGEEPPQLNEAGIALARQSFLVLSAWRDLPGLEPDGSVDGNYLHTWVSRVRALLEQAGRPGKGESYLGQLLSGSPVGRDGAWPAEPVRDLLDEDRGKSLGRGFVIDRLNAQGVTYRSLYEGGHQEEVAAEEFETWSSQVMARWPVTGRLLRDIALEYRDLARYHDRQAEASADAG